MRLSLTRRQYYTLCTMALLSPLLHLVPRKTAAEAGCGGWLSGAAALVPLLLFAALLEGILRRGRPGEGIGEITLRALGPVAGAAVLFFAAFTGGATPETPGRARCAMRWCVRTCVLVTLLSVFTIGNLGAGLTAQLNHPFFTLLRNISLFHAVERFGALVIGLWVLPDFVLVAMLLTLAVNCLRAACTRNAQLFARKNPPALVLLCAAAVGAGALLLAQNAFDTDALQTNVVPRLNLALLGLGTVGTYLTGRARKAI